MRHWCDIGDGSRCRKMTKKTVLTVLQMKFIGMEVLKRVRAKRELPFLQIAI